MVEHRLDAVAEPVARIWQDNYPEGVPPEVALDTYPSVKALMEQSFQRFAEKPAYSNMGATLSFAELDRLSRRFGAYLQQHLQLQRGDRIAVMLPNLLQYPVAALGALRAGLCVVNVNPLYTPRELAHQLNDSGAETIVILENFAHVLQQVVADTPVKNIILTRIGDGLPTLKGAMVNLVVKRVKKMVPAWQLPGHIPFKATLATNHTLNDVSLNQDDIAFLQYTGGTTGLSKGATLTHGNLLANLAQVEAWMNHSLSEGREVVITALPLYHIFSLTINCLLFLKLGGHNVLITNPRDMPAFVKELGKHRFSVITGVNTLFNGLLNTKGFDQLDFEPLVLSIGGGMAVQKAVADHWQQVTNSALVEGYGLTETSPVACCNRIDVKAYSGGIGYPVPSTDVCVKNEAGEILATGNEGELCVRGPQVMRGYWNRPQETDAAIKNGWFHTGDIGVIDEQGFIKLVDRKKDMILVSGFNVYPNEIEDVLALHPGVLEAAAIGISDEKSGEIVKAFIVKKDPALTEAQLREHCKANLTAYKAPRLYEFRDDLPKTNVGKILRRELRDG